MKSFLKFLGIIIFAVGIFILMPSCKQEAEPEGGTLLIYNSLMKQQYVKVTDINNVAIVDWFNLNLSRTEVLFKKNSYCVVLYYAIDDIIDNLTAKAFYISGGETIVYNLGD